MGTITDKAYDADQEARREQTKAKVDATLPQPYKPLLSLANDEAACRKIFELVLKDFMWEYIDQEKLNNLLQLRGYLGNNRQKSVLIGLWKDGQIFARSCTRSTDTPSERSLTINPFEVVDLIRSLGYSNI